VNDTRSTSFAVAVVAVVKVDIHTKKGLQLKKKDTCFIVDIYREMYTIQKIRG